MIDANTILRELDEAAARYDYPVLDNAYFHFAAIRLVAFRSATEWLISFQELAVSTKHGLDFTNTVSAYGNLVSRPGTQYGFTRLDQHRRIPFSRDGRPASQLNPSRFELEFPDGVVTSFEPTRDEYLAAHVDPDDSTPSSAKILRYLASAARSRLFLSDSELLGVSGRSDSDARVFIKLDEWQHPDVADDELPSDTPCFQSLAKSLAVGQPELYRCDDANMNTYWWMWEQAS